METLILALLATPLVFSLVMAFLPKNTSYNVFAGLNLVSVAAVLVLSIMAEPRALLACGSTSIRWAPSLCCSSALSVFLRGCSRCPM